MTKKKISGQKRSIIEALIFLAILIGGFGLLAWKMGSGNMLNTMMNTAHSLILNVVLYLMGITVLTGALSKLMAEFGVVTLLEKLLRPLMKPLFNLPGVAALGGGLFLVLLWPHRWEWLLTGELLLVFGAFEVCIFLHRMHRIPFSPAIPTLQKALIVSFMLWGIWQCVKSFLGGGRAVKQATGGH